jgi:hypothetical protein
MSTDRGPTGRRHGQAIDVAESRRLTRALTARRALSTRLTPGPRRKTGSASERSAHLKHPHD